MPARTCGAAAYFQRAEVRDVLAWLRALADPNDSGAVVRALSRPPVELRSVDVARLTQLARRRKLDMPSAVAAALEGPQLSEEGRDRARVFLQALPLGLERLRGPPPRRLRPAPDRAHRPAPPAGVRHARRHRRAAAQHREAVRARHRLHAPRAARHRARLHPLPRRRRRVGPARGGGHRHAHRARRAGDDDGGRRAGSSSTTSSCSASPPRAMPGPYRPEADGVPAELLKDARARRATAARRTRRRCAQLLHLAMTRARKGLVLAWAEAGRRARTRGRRPSTRRRWRPSGVEEEVFEEELFGPAEGLHSTFRIMRDELLDTVARMGGRLGEMRLDTYLDVDQAVSRYLELIKVAALIERAKEGQSLDAALPARERDPAPVRHAGAARDPRAVGARQLAARHRARPRRAARAPRRTAPSRRSTRSSRAAAAA